MWWRFGAAREWTHNRYVGGGARRIARRGRSFRVVASAARTAIGADWAHCRRAKFMEAES
jgi:hypothetical protein